MCAQSQLWGAGFVQLEVRAANAGARAFYRVVGFSEVERHPSYYAASVDDAVVMARAL